MTITLTWAKVLPFLSPRAVAEKTRTEQWLPVLQLLLNHRYDDAITTDNEPVFVSFTADAINRRVSRPAEADFVAQQSVGPASVRYLDRAALSRWFMPEELDQMDDLSGVGNIRSKRTPAPDAQRFGNMMRFGYDTADESCEGDL